MRSSSVKNPGYWYICTMYHKLSRHLYRCHRCPFFSVPLPLLFWLIVPLPFPLPLHRYIQSSLPIRLTLPLCGSSILYICVDTFRYFISKVYVTCLHNRNFGHDLSKFLFPIYRFFEIFDTISNTDPNHQRPTPSIVRSRRSHPPRAQWKFYIPIFSIRYVEVRCSDISKV